MKRIASLLFTLPAVAVACSSDPGGGGSADAGTDAAAEVPASLVGRDSDPVVLTGASLPTLLGKPPGDVVAFARSGGAWQAVPVQVDERFLGDFCQVYAASKLGANAPCKTALKIETLFYADPSTYTGADPNAALDPDDEVVLMARQAGARWSGSDAPTGVTPGSAVEVQLADGPSSAFVYLFVRSDATLPPSAGQDLVSYQQTFENVPAGFAYKNDYPFTGSGSCGYNPNDPPIPCNAPILEDSVVKSAAYERHFAARWVTDRLRITQPGSDGIDVLDDAQARFAPNVCGRTVNTFSTAEGAFIANVDGPVRAIRSYLGANSGPLTQRTHLFYDRLEVVQTMLRVHQVGGIMDLEDYAPAATGMTYASSEVPGGVPIDGQPDAVAGAVPAWELISGPHGSILHTLRVNASMPVTSQAYYLDDANADVTSDQCELSNVGSPDQVAWGQSGAWLTSTIPDTDPRNGSVEHVFFERTSWYEAPGFDVAHATARAGQAPLRSVARAVGASGGCGDGTCDAGESCVPDCAPYRAACGDQRCDPWENSVSCGADCSSGAASANTCGNGTCDAGEQKLNCAPDCWTQPYVAFAACLKTRCATPYGACGDEQPCVDDVTCVVECVKGGTAQAACETTCGASNPVDSEQKEYADALLQCATKQKCAATL